MENIWVFISWKWVLSLWNIIWSQQIYEKICHFYFLFTESTIQIILLSETPFQLLSCLVLLVSFRDKYCLRKLFNLHKCSNYLIWHLCVKCQIIILRHSNSVTLGNFYMLSYGCPGVCGKVSRALNSYFHWSLRLIWPF